MQRAKEYRTVMEGGNSGIHGKKSTSEFSIHLSAEIQDGNSCWEFQIRIQGANSGWQFSLEFRSRI